MNVEFKVHRLTEKGLAKAQRLAENFDRLLTELQADIPNGRYLAIVKTKLEEACFFAKKGIAELPENQQ